MRHLIENQEAASAKPFSKPAAPFTIGLRPLSPSMMLQIDDQLPKFTAQKRELYESRFDDVCMAEPGTEDAQAEAAELILNNLKNHHADLYDPGRTPIIASDGLSIEIPKANNMPLAPVALLVQDDLVLMRHDDNGWRLVAASLCFPSSWNLREKFAHPLETIHAPVPLPEKMGQRINRIFDNLQPHIPVCRENWSLENSPALRLDPLEECNNKGKPLTAHSTFRREFQTLHKLHNSGDILFTIRIKTEPLAALLDTKSGRNDMVVLLQQYLAMNDAQKSYKHISDAQALLDWLAGQGVTP